MSDTDKDKPRYVVAEWWEPRHIGCQEAWPLRRWQGRIPSDHECDLPSDPVVGYSRTWSLDSGCHWVPAWPRRGDRFYRRPYPHPPRWFVRHVWWGPERVATRVDGRRAVAEYRATGDVDVEPRLYQHRHGARWQWA
jgi:hypothetical protein